MGKDVYAPAESRDRRILSGGPNSAYAAANAASSGAASDSSSGASSTANPHAGCNPGCDPSGASPSPNSTSEPQGPRALRGSRGERTLSANVYYDSSQHCRRKTLTSGRYHKL